MKHESEIRAELADLYVAKLPKLGLAENEAALTVLVDVKIEEIKQTILRDQAESAHLAYLEERDYTGAIMFLKSLGALPRADDPDHEMVF